MYRPHTNGDEIALEQEFEWVNAWAASTHDPSAPSEAAVVKDHPAPSQSEKPQSEKPQSEKPQSEKPQNGKVPAHGDTAVRDAPRAAARPPEAADGAKLHVRPIDLVSALDPDPAAPVASDAGPEQFVVGHSKPDFIRINGVEALDSSANIAGEGRESGHRRSGWTSMIRLVARKQGQQRADRTDADAARDLFVLDAAPAASRDDAKPVPLPHNAAAVPDQLACDIAEIERVRDKLLAMPVAHAASLSAIAAVRTSDAVPILVGIVLALTSMMVFAVAASFVSLR